jgi:UDPglucose--hexose-1-phosphate uridylyltransferase
VATGVWSLHRPRNPNAAAKPVGYAASQRTQLLTHERPDYVAQRNPFDLSNQHMTPPVKMTIDDPADPTKPLIRVFNNKFPVLRERTGDPDVDAVKVAFAQGLFPELSGIGDHEVVVQHHRYNMCEALMTDREVVALWGALQQRFNSVGQTSRYVQLLENHGQRSGGSLPHPHSQLLGLPFVPGEQMARLQMALDFFRLNRSCVFDSIVAKTEQEKQRVLFAGTHVLAFVPNAEERRNEIWIVPRGSGANFGAASKEVLEELALACRSCLGML